MTQPMNEPVTAVIYCYIALDAIVTFFNITSLFFEGIFNELNLIL